MDPAEPGPKKHHRWRRRKNVPSVSMPRSSAPQIQPVDAVVESTSAPKPEVVRPRVPPRRPNRQMENANITERILLDLKRGYECMVCMSLIRFSQPVWNCKTCHSIMHLSCMHQWIKRNSHSTTGYEWRCPGCQYVYLSTSLPTNLCYCGRVENPVSSRQYTAHSCGGACGRPRISTSCVHPCPLPCHPGPCPSCTALVAAVPCYCGGRDSTGYVRCGDEKSVPHSCGGVCGKSLGCGGLHTCARECHKGACGECTRIVGDCVCFCGKSSKPAICAQRSSPFSCGKLCGIPFSCGVHSCARTCHETACHDTVCPFDPSVYDLSVCACGRPRNTHTDPPMNSPIRAKCTDPLPTCSETCGRVISRCGHACTARCHTGLCPPCQEKVVQHCRCGRTKRTVPCSSVETNTVFSCDLVCRSMKSCSKHRCDIVCCGDHGRKDSMFAPSHLCWQPCGKPLSCGNHTCDQLCHLGKCKPCAVLLRDVGVFCGCGKNTIPPPVACGTPAPACISVCAKKLPNCNHTCMSRCHLGDCSLCTVLVDKLCAGSHTMLTSVKCHAKNISCGIRCGKSLPCGIHTCALNCHAGPCSEDSKCPQKCTEKRSDCGHICSAPCHIGVACPTDFPCRERVTVSCDCGLRSEDTVCRGVSSSASGIKPHLPCSIECERHQRQAVLRNAFREEGLKNVSAGSDDAAASGTGLCEQYSGDLINQVEQFDKKFIRLIDSLLVDAVESRARTLHLPAMDSVRRWITLEYAQLHYRFDVEVIKESVGSNSRNSEKSVVVHYVPGQTRTPTPMLSQLVEMNPSQTLKYIVDFGDDGPKIHFYDVAKGYGKFTIERVRECLKSFIGAYRTRRGTEGTGEFDMYLDFVDANKAVAAFRKLQATPGMEQCRILNVPLFEPHSESEEKTELGSTILDDQNAS